MKWVKIQQGEIVRIEDTCPKNLTNVSNFASLSDEDKKKYGWFKVTPDSTQVKAWETVSNVSYNVESLGEVFYDVEESQGFEVVEDEEGNKTKVKLPNEVVQKSYIDYTIQEVKSINQMSLAAFKDLKYEELSTEAQKYILEKYPMTMQLSAREGWYGEPKSTEIVSWVKSHFDIIMQVKSDLYSKNSFANVDAVYFRKDLNDNPTNPNWSFWGE